VPNQFIPFNQGERRSATGAPPETGTYLSRKNGYFYNYVIKFNRKIIYVSRAGKSLTIA
jgi:hypothetical protein